MPADNQLPGRLNAGDRCAVRRRRQEGETLQAIADDYGVTRQNIHLLTRDLPRPPRQRRTNEALKEQIIAVYQAGNSLANTGRIVGASRSLVTTVITDAGIKKKGAVARQLRADRSRIQALVAFYRQGYTVASTARRFSVAPGTAASHIRQAGVMRSTRETRLVDPESPYREKRLQAVELYQQGLFQKEVSDRLGVSQSFVRRNARRAGLDTSLKGVMERRRTRQKETAAALQPPMKTAWDNRQYDSN